MSTPKQDQIAQNFKVLNADKTRSAIISDSALNNLAESTQILDTNNKQFKKMSNPSDPAVIFDLVERPYAVKDEDNVFTGVNTFDKDIITCNVVPKTNGGYSLGLTNKRYNIYANDVNTHNIIPATNGDYDIGNSTKSYNALYAGKLYTDVVINGSKLDCTSGNTITTSLWGVSRSFTIQDASGQNSGASTSVNGSEAVTLHLPGAIKADVTGNLNGNASSADEADHANTASSATKLTTSAGGGKNPIYFSSGKPVASSATVGAENLPVYLKNGVITSVKLSALKTALGLDEFEQPDDPGDVTPADTPETAETGYYYYAGAAIAKNTLAENALTSDHTQFYTTWVTKSGVPYNSLGGAQAAFDDVLDAGTYLTKAAASNEGKVGTVSGQTVIAGQPFTVYKQKMVKIATSSSQTAGTGEYFYIGSSYVNKDAIFDTTNPGTRSALYKSWTGKHANSASNSSVDNAVGGVILTSNYTGKYLATSSASIVASTIYVNINGSTKTYTLYKQSFTKVYSDKKTFKSILSHTKGTNVAGSHLCTEIGEYFQSITGQQSGTWLCTTATTNTGSTAVLPPSYSDEMLSNCRSLGGDPSSNADKGGGGYSAAFWNIKSGTYVKIG